jgi:hypothetical protein
VLASIGAGADASGLELVLATCPLPVAIDEK